MNPILLEKAENVVNTLKATGFKIATAESCTGGLVSAYLTAVSGVSDVFELGVTSYSCRIKNKILGVSQKTLDEVGAISRETASQMAENVREKAEADLGVAVTGVAGPSSSEGHPVGYVFISIAGEKGTEVKLFFFWWRDSKDQMRLSGGQSLADGESGGNTSIFFPPGRKCKRVSPLGP